MARSSRSPIHTRRFSRVFIFLFSILTVVFGFFAVPTVHAQQLDTGLNAVGQATGLPATDPRVIAVRIINISLGFLAIIMLGLMLYAGFSWMTSGGNAEKVESAKRMIRNAVIGVVIILSSWAITTFVINKLLQATGGGGGVISSNEGGGGGLGGGGAFSVFQVQSITPSGSVPIRNVEVRFLFTRPVDPASAASNIRVTRVSDGTVVDGEITVADTLVTFVPSATCPAPNADRHCFDANADFKASVGGSLRSVGKQTIACGGFAPSCSGTFKTGNLIDTSAPTASIVSPVDYQSVPQNSSITVLTQANDDAGVSYVETSVNGASIGKDGPNATSSVLDFQASIPWDTTGIPLGTYSLQSKVHDIDSNQNQSSVVHAVVRPAHCFDGAKNDDETGLDCGGSCGACSGQSCRIGADCSSGMCVAGACVEQPIITGFDPPDGKAGTFVTITGVNFGATPGSVVFTSNVAASAPAACSNFRTWSPNQVVVAVPEGAVSGAIKLTNATSKLSDSTIDANGPRLDPFNVNAVARPGLCGADPDHGLPGDRVKILGTNLGEAPGRLAFSDRQIASFISWSANAIELNAPVVAPGTYGVQATVDTVLSNTVNYRIEEQEKSAPPIITSIDPASGPVGEYVTLSGTNFGDQTGTVKFKYTATGEEGLADTKFPAACSVNFWHDTSVVVKVPATIGPLSETQVKPGAYQFTLIRHDLMPSNAMPFTVMPGDPKPGLCSIAPTVGPVGTDVTLSGERFGVNAGSVAFASADGKTVNADVDPVDWKPVEIKTSAPAGSITGKVTVTAGKATSNGVNFQVQNCNETPNICAKGEICCQNGQCSVNGSCALAPQAAEYAWQTSTGRIPQNPRVVEECPNPPGNDPPSPSPWSRRSGEDRVCVNAEVVVRFTTELDPATVNPNTVLIRKCTGAGDNPCSEAMDLSRTAPITLAPDPAEPIFFTFHPKSGLWDTSSTYQVILTTGIQSKDGIHMLEDAKACGKGNAYCFRFGTRASSDLCKVGYVGVNPDAYKAKGYNVKVPYAAFGLSADDMCIVLNTDTMDWKWYTGQSLAGPPDGRAFIPVTNLNYRLEMATATTLGATNNDPVKVNAELLQASGGAARGTAHLSIDPEPPFVEAFGPACDQACQNAAIWARFNVDMLRSSFSPDNFVLRRCVNQNCRAFDLIYDSSKAAIHLSDATSSSGEGARDNFLVIEPWTGVGLQTFLEPGRFYKFTLLKPNTAVPGVSNGGNVGIRSATRLALTHLNDTEGFAWTFRVKQNPGAMCAVDHVTVAPEEKIETYIGARQTFAAHIFSAPDSCNASGEPLIVNQSFDWQNPPPDPVVAALLDGSGQSLQRSVSRLLAPRCGFTCLNLGSDGVSGKTASCSNGVVETTDARYCWKKSDHTATCVPGDADCQTKLDQKDCVILPPGSQGGEECDLGNGNGPNSLCNASCLWNPAKSVLEGGTCGNGKVDIGEQCDPGLTCIKGAIGQACTKDADCGAGGACGLTESHGCSDTCQALGSVAGGSVCGNDDVADGETCDDANANPGDGCSQQCLHEGSKTVTALCGNGRLEAGESCETCPNGVLMPDPANPLLPPRCLPLGTRTLKGVCDPKTCLNLGSSQCGEANAGCCGNGSVDPGEDCDLGAAGNNGMNGCSPRCLALGSSEAYANPSFCADGVIGAGEQCDAPPADQNHPYFVDASQLAQITGTVDPGPSGLLSTPIQANYAPKNGTATYGLRCGFTDENKCFNPNVGGSFGLTTGGCCALRPYLVSSYPSAGAGGICRNTLIQLTFTTKLNPATVTPNLVIAKELPANAKTCPSGTEPLAFADPKSAGTLFAVWSQFKTWIWGTQAAAAPAPALKWCVGGITGTFQLDTPKSGHVVLNQVLEPDTNYRLYFRGELRGNPATSTAVRSDRGVASLADPVDADIGPMSFTFRTGSKICEVKKVVIQDTAATPGLFTKPSDPHTMIATPMTVLQNGTLAPIASTPAYGWKWGEWVSGRSDIFFVSKDQNDPTKAVVTAANANGSSFVLAELVISNDTVNIPSSTGDVVDGTLPVTASMCQRPWPEEAPAPFADFKGSKSLEALAPAFKNGPYFNFSTTYCLDRDTSTTTDDLPVMDVHAVPLSQNDAAQGILRQYLFTFSQANLRKDGIGIRVLANPAHLAPSAWYAAHGFTGSPQATAVDGYEAIKDGTSVYVAGTNVEDIVGGPVTSTVYLLSVNPDARPETQNIFQQLLKNMSVNVNVMDDTDGICKFTNQKGQYQQYLDKDGHVVTCGADWECAKAAPNLHCANARAKLRRDTRRLADFQTISAALESASVRAGRYPTLSSGSFLQTYVSSRWPSWQKTFGAELGGALPQDPVNRYLSCGYCSASKTVPCQAASDCPAGETCAPSAIGRCSKTVGQTCSRDADCPGGETCLIDQYDPATCYSSSTHASICPMLDPATVSRTYQYRSVQGGTRYELSTELEGPTVYVPPLLREVRVCSNTGALCVPQSACVDTKGAVGKVCQKNADCGAGQTCVRDPSCQVRDAKGIVTSSGTCNGTGGIWKYRNTCSNTRQGVSNVCGDGVVGPDELCELGQTATAPCSIVVDKNGKTVEGTKIQICSDCNAFIDSPATRCVANSLCGNGRIDNLRCYQKDPNQPAGFKYGQSCNADADCADPRDVAIGADKNMVCESVAKHGGKEEQCDDGAQNGTYGHCACDCSDVGATCGDAQLSLGESCDNGNQNGQYCGKGCDLSKSCSLDCRTNAPHCGDQIVQPPDEQCDTATEQTSKGICLDADASLQIPCDTNADCKNGDLCGADPNVNAPPNAKACTDPAKICSNNAKRSCASDVDCSAVCDMNSKTCINDNAIACTSNFECGQSGRCLSYPTVHTRTCLLPGDANQCQWPVTWSVCVPQNSCGDGHTDPGEECDDGNKNDNDGCTSQCKKNVCGDGLLNPGAEECDYALKNGQPCSNADYGSTCLGCSNTCHFTSTSGGYCGDRIVNGGEQCDGTNVPKTIGQNGALLTCRALGFDYAANVSCDHYEYCLLKNGSIEVNRAQQGDFNFKMFPQVCAWNGGKDVPAGTGSVPGTIAAQVCKASASDIISCTDGCTFTGCRMCQDERGSGSIEGTVYDAVYSNQPVPSARVTLYLRGVKVDQTFTDGDGKFSFSQMNTRPECSTYRIIVDSYKDNLCTGKHDGKTSCGGPNNKWTLPYSPNESTFGGYWAYESNTFDADHFLSDGIQNENGKIFLIPRVGGMDTLVVFTWNGDISQRPIDMHLVLPKPIYYAYCPTGVDDNNQDPDGQDQDEYNCIHADGICADTPPNADGTCPPPTKSRRYKKPVTGRADVAADDDSMKAVYESAWLPYGNIHCYDSSGKEVRGCEGNSSLSAQTMRFKRGDWAVIGQHSLYLVDRNGSGPQGTPAQYFSKIKATVRVVTGSRLYTITPPGDASCDNQNAPQGQFWLAFRQDEAAGRVTVDNRLLCKGSPAPGEGGNVNLPQPLWWIGDGGKNIYAP